MLRWKGGEITNLIMISGIEMTSKKVLEIGCADGILLRQNATIISAVKLYSIRCKRNIHRLC